MTDTRTDRESVERLAKAIRAYQQADEDGIMVLTSRQACDEIADTSIALLAERDALQADVLTWRKVAQRMTPGGSEYFDPKAVEAHIDDFRERFHKAMTEKVLLGRKVDALQAKLDEAQAELREARMQAISDGCEVDMLLEAQIGRVKNDYDFAPDLGAKTREPTIREILVEYYTGTFSRPVAVDLTNQYLKALTTAQITPAEAAEVLLMAQYEHSKLEYPENLGPLCQLSTSALRAIAAQGREDGE